MRLFMQNNDRESKWSASKLSQMQVFCRGNCKQQVWNYLTAASVAVFYSLDFSYANYEQSRARIHRIGQTKKCLYIHLIAKNTIDEKVMDALRRKSDVARLMVDDYKKLIRR